MLQNYTGISYFDKCMNAFLTDFVTALKDRFPDTGGCSWFWETYLAWNARPNPHRFPPMYSRTPPGRTRYTACGCTRCTSSVSLIVKGVQDLCNKTYLPANSSYCFMSHVYTLSNEVFAFNLRIWFESFSFYYSFGVFLWSSKKC